MFNQRDSWIIKAIKIDRALGLDKLHPGFQAVRMASGND